MHLAHQQLQLSDNESALLVQWQRLPTPAQPRHCQYQLLQTEQKHFRQKQQPRMQPPWPSLHGRCASLRRKLPRQPGRLYLQLHRPQRRSALRQHRQSPAVLPQRWEMVRASAQTLRRRTQWAQKSRPTAADRQQARSVRGQPPLSALQRANILGMRATLAQQPAAPAQPRRVAQWLSLGALPAAGMLRQHHR